MNAEQISDLRTKLALTGLYAQEITPILDALESAQSERDALQARLDALTVEAVALPEGCPRVEQSILHEPPSTYGNCLSAVIAGLLKIPVEAVPHFSDPRVVPDNWQKPLNEWLNQFGLAYVETRGLDFEDSGIDGMWHEITGKSPREHAVLHACAGMDGREQWDPHPSQDGLVRSSNRWFGLLVALRPWEVAAASRIRAMQQAREVV